MTSKSPEEIQAETQTLWNNLTTPIYDEFLASDQTLSSYNASCQKLKSTYPDFKNVDVIISSFVTTNSFKLDTSPLDFCHKSRLFLFSIRK